MLEGDYMARFFWIGKAQPCKVGCTMKTREKLTLLNKFGAMGENGASALLENYGLNTYFPVDIVELITRLGIKIIPYDFSRMEQSEQYAKDVVEKGFILGASTANDDSIGIFYKKDDHINRIRFTLAHELAHCCLHMSPENYESNVDFRTDTIATEGREFDANVFAGELLMPEKELRYAHSNLVKPYLTSLTKIFGVSENVMQARLKYLNLEYEEETLSYGR